MPRRTDSRGQGSDGEARQPAQVAGHERGLVTQRGPRRYLKIYRRARLLAQKCELRRKPPLDRLDAGDQVEDGPIRVRVEESAQSRSSTRNVALLLGPEEVERLEEPVERTVCRPLVVTDSGCWGRSGATSPTAPAVSAIAA